MLRQHSSVYLSQTLFLQIPFPQDFQDDDLRGCGESILADGEGAGIEGPNLVRSIDKLLQNAHVIPKVHGNDDLWFQLFDHLLGPFRSDGVDSPDGLEEDMSEGYVKRPFFPKLPLLFSILVHLI